MPLFETERRGRVVVVRVDHPPHNFMTAEMVRDLGALFDSLRGDRSVGAVVITGKPERLYITHYDVGEILASVERAGIAAPPWLTSIVLRIAGAVRRVPIVRDLAERTPLAAVFELYRVHDLFLSMNRSEKVFIAAINGPATGGGCETSLACDIRVMADADIAIGLPEMTVDFNPGAGGTPRLPRLIGGRRATGAGRGGRRPHRRATRAPLARGDPLAQAGGLRGWLAPSVPRVGGGAEVVHGLVGHRVLKGEDGSDATAGRGRRAISVDHVGVARALAGGDRRERRGPGG